ncbi:MAG: hypothetical protein WC792_04675 [Candidatus Micrarchaeia archaeon]|jgi:hypothetical protein
MAAQRAAKPYKPVVIGVNHRPENVAGTIRSIQAALDGGRRSVGLEATRKELAGLQKPKDDFFIKIARHLEPQGIDLHVLDGSMDKEIFYNLGDGRAEEIERADRKERELYEKFAGASDGELLRQARKFPKEIAIAYASGPLRNKYMLRQIQRAKPEVVVVGYYHAPYLARALGTRVCADYATRRKSHPHGHYYGLYEFTERAYRLLKKDKIAQRLEARKAG